MAGAENSRKAKKIPNYINLWERSVLCAPKHFIMTTEYTNKGDKCHFHPSYEKESVNMAWLLSFQYARIWEQEKITWDETKPKLGDDERKKLQKKKKQAEAVKNRKLKNIEGKKIKNTPEKPKN